MQRERLARFLWFAGAALLLVSLPLVFGNFASDAARGKNEEIGVALGMLGAAVALVGVAVLGELGRWDARAVAAAALFVLVAPAAWVALLVAMEPDHDAQRQVMWERLEGEPHGETPRLSLAELPGPLEAALAEAEIGQRGSVVLTREENEAFWKLVRSRGGALSRPEAIAAVGDGLYRFMRGP